MMCRTVKYSGHAFQQMLNRLISPVEVLAVIENGIEIASYPDDTPLPSVLLMCYVGTRPLHVVVGISAGEDVCHVITAYEPNRELWTDNFTKRR